MKIIFLLHCCLFGCCLVLAAQQNTPKTTDIPQKMMETPVHWFTQTQLREMNPRRCTRLLPQRSKKIVIFPKHDYAIGVDRPR